jgi:hypothetical protein
MSAKVWLVGAGPGDPELLTLKAVRALNEADVVLIDDLVNEAVLQHCPRARIIAVGKRGGCRSTPQAFIHRLMLRYARQGGSRVAIRAFLAGAVKRRSGCASAAWRSSWSMASRPDWRARHSAIFR